MKFCISTEYNYVSVRRMLFFGSARGKEKAAFPSGCEFSGLCNTSLRTRRLLHHFTLILEYFSTCFIFDAVGAEAGAGISKVFIVVQVLREHACKKRLVLFRNVIGYPNSYVRFEKYYFSSLLIGPRVRLKCIIWSRQIKNILEASHFLNIHVNKLKR